MTADTSRLGTRALVTGGTSGLGFEFADALGARGLDLVIVARDPERLATTADDLMWRHGIEVETMTADLAERDAAVAVADRLAALDQPIDTLVNNAGHGLHRDLATRDTVEHERSIDVMVRSVLLLGGAAATSMRERGRGLIINVASVAGTVPMGAYSAIKAWVLTYSESLSLELAGSGVHVTTLMPGWVRTEFHQRAKIRTSAIPRLLWLSSPRVVADCLRDVERGKLRSIPSKRFKLVTFLVQYAPRPLVHRATAIIKGGRS